MLFLSEIALERLLLTWILGGKDLDFAGLEPNVETRVHTTGDVSKCDTLVDSILEEGDSPVPRIIKYTYSRCHLLTLTSVAENCARL